MENSIPKEKLAEKKKSSIWKERTLLERYLVLMCILLLIAFLVMIGVLLHIQNLRKRSQKNEVCLSDVCKYEAGSILKNMDFSVDPCQNFYQFACGSHMKYKDIYSPEIYSDTDLFGYILYQSKEILEKSKFLDDYVFYNKVKKYYQSCLKKPTIISEILEEFLSVNQLDSWPISEVHHSMSIIEYVTVLSEIYDGEGLLFSFSLRSNNTSIKLYNGMTTVDTDVLLNTTEEEFIIAKEQYLDLFYYVFMKLRVPIEESKRYIEEMIEFETSLAKIVKEHRDDNLTNLSISKLESQCPQIKWNDMFKLIFEYAGSADKYNEEILVKLSSMEYIKDLCQLIGTSNKNKRIIYNLQIWNIFIRYLAKFDFTFRQLVTDRMYININDIKFLPGMDKLKWKACIMDMDFVIRLGLEYAWIMSVNSKDEIKEVKSYAEQIAETLEEIFSEEDWFDNYSKNNTITKLQRIKYNIGYSNISINLEFVNQIFSNLVITDSYMRNLLFISRQKFSGAIFNNSISDLLDKERYFQPFEVSAYYRGFPMREDLVIPLGLINSPFFVYGLPKYINYGGIAFVIAHEFSHGFDRLEQEKEQTEEMIKTIGTYHESMGIKWPDAFIEEFNQRKDCMINQYFQFPLEGNLTVDGNQTIRDNIADNSGIIVSFRAYEKYLKRRGTEPSLPGLDFTNKQMFFIGYAQTWCELIDSMKNSYELDDHSPGKYRKSSIWKERTLLERYLVLMCILLLIAFLVMIGVLLYIQNVGKRSQKNEICLSDVCKYEAGSILKNMDFSVDPCENFYQFACGSYMKYKDIYSPEIDIVTNLMDYILYQSKEILEKSTILDDYVFYNKVKKYYQSCLKKPTNISEILEEFLSVNQLDSWPISEDHHSTSIIENVTVLSQICEGNGMLFGFFLGSNNTYINV